MSSKNVRALAALLLLAAGPACAGTQLTGGVSPDVPWMRLVLSFAFCVLVAAGAVLALKRFEAKGRAAPFSSLLGRKALGGGRAIQVLETRRISVHADLCLIEFDGERMLLAATAHGVEILDKSRPEIADARGDES